MFFLRRKSESAESANELHVPSLSKSLSSSGSLLFVSAEKKISRKPTSLRCESFSKLFLFEKTLFFFVLFCLRKKKKMRNVFVFDFEMQITNSCLQIFSSVWTQIVWTFDIKLAEICANKSFVFLCLFCFVEFDLEETK